MLRKSSPTNANCPICSVGLGWLIFRPAFRNSVIDTARKLEIKRVPVGLWPGGTVVDPEGRRIYVANNKSSTLTIIGTPGS